MNRKLLAALAAIPLALTACSATNEASLETDTPAVEQPATPIEMSSLYGKTVAEATVYLSRYGLQPELEYTGVDRTIADDIVEASSSTFLVADYEQPVDGVSTVALTAEPDEDFLSAYMPFLITCEGEAGDNVDEADFRSVEAVWESKAFKRYVNCEAKLDSDGWEPDTKQQEAIKLVNEYSVQGTIPDEAAIEMSMEICSLPPRNPDSEWAGVELSILKGAAILCDDAPFHKELQAWADEKRFAGAILNVPEELKPGTYQTVRKANGCHWYHMDPDGGFYQLGPVQSPQILKATVKDGDTLYADTECGIWVKK